MQVSSSDGPLCVKRSVREGRVLCWFVQFCILEGGITSVLFFLNFASGTQNFVASARQAGVKGEDENHHVF